MVEDKDLAEPAPEDPPEPVLRMSARATGREAATLTPEQIEAAEEEAAVWARRVNSC